MYVEQEIIIIYLVCNKINAYKESGSKLMCVQDLLK